MKDIGPGPDAGGCGAARPGGCGGMPGGVGRGEGQDLC